LSESLHERIVERLEAGIAASPQVSAVLTREALASRKDVPLAISEDYSLFSNTLSLAGVSDPELAIRLGRHFGVELLSVAQLSYLPCGVCEEGDQVWLVGQVVDAGTGRLVFRAHLHTQVSTEDAGELARIGEELADAYLEVFEVTFRLKWHRQRFEHLRHAS
jgi:hypothetical protein